MNRKTIMLESKTVGCGHVQAGVDVSHLSETEKRVLVGMGWAVNVEADEAEAVSGAVARAADLAAKQASAKDTAVKSEPPKPASKR